MKKKIIAALLAGAMVFSLAACGGSGGSGDSGDSGDGGDDKKADMKIAMVTDSGDITDQSFCVLTLMLYIKL